MNCSDAVYEPQLTLAGERTCGAAALCMVYRSMGLECRQEEVWARLKQSRRVMGGARSCSLAADALRQGLAALVVQAHEPWPFLLACWQAGAGVILNHRLTEHSPWGHYTVLERIDEQSAWLHDPQFGPQRCLAREELMHLWHGRPGRAEIAGYVAIVITGRDPDPDSMECPNCRQGIELQPHVAIGTSKSGSTLWRRIYCPGCDWSLSPGDLGDRFRT